MQKIVRSVNQRIIGLYFAKISWKSLGDPRNLPKKSRSEGVCSSNGKNLLAAYCALITRSCSSKRKPLRLIVSKACMESVNLLNMTQPWQ